MKYNTTVASYAKNFISKKIKGILKYIIAHITFTIYQNLLKNNSQFVFFEKSQLRKIVIKSSLFTKLIRMFSAKAKLLGVLKTNINLLLYTTEKSHFNNCVSLSL